jgi:short subunit fatty acids transporter
MVRHMLGHDAVGIARIASETGLTRQTVYRIKDDPQPKPRWLRQGVAGLFGDGFWSLITFTMQMAMIVISGYVVAASPAAAWFIEGLAALPRTDRGALAFVAAVSMLVSLVHWAMALIFAGLLVRALGRRLDLAMDYRAGAGFGSSAAQLQANPAYNVVFCQLNTEYYIR